MQQPTKADELAAELAALKLQLVEEEASWAKWREGHKALTSDAKTDGLQQLRDRIFFLEAKLARTKR